MLSFNPVILSTECLITMANAVSKDITEYEMNGRNSLSPSDAMRVRTELDSIFAGLCNELERQNVVLSDVVLCPLD